MLDAIKESEIKTKFYQASSSEMFGNSKESPQNENTIFNPRSPYACAKVFAHYLTVNYREAYNLFACSGILFNHESPRRGETFVSRKITRGFARIKLGLDDKLILGNLEAKRDWGFAPEYIEAMWLMLQQDKPDDFVIATGENHTVREFVEKTAKYFDFDLEWQGTGVKEKGIDKKSGKIIVEISESYFRPAEVDELIGDYSKAKELLNWEPKVKFDELVNIMSEADFKQQDKK